MPPTPPAPSFVLSRATSAGDDGELALWQVRLDAARDAAGPERAAANAAMRAAEAIVCGRPARGPA